MGGCRKGPMPFTFQLKIRRWLSGWHGASCDPTSLSGDSFLLIGGGLIGPSSVLIVLLSLELISCLSYDKQTQYGRGVWWPGVFN